MHILHVVGARPNFMKAAPVLTALRKRANVQQTVVHTGQHYDPNMSSVFFAQLGIPQPDANLEVGSGSHAQQTSAIMSAFEREVLQRRPDVVVVYGDVNSTVAAALVCSKLLIPIVHVEAGLRSFDRTMPEEINRLLTDQIADMLFTPSADADQNLTREGIAIEKIFRVGNVMIDSLIRLFPACEQYKIGGLPRQYAVVTLHRPSNVDAPDVLGRIVETLSQIDSRLPIVFPVHPRTRQRISDLGLNPHSMRLLEPLPYMEFLALVRDSTAVITDSGGIQEETTYLGIPCLTLRRNTERPITVEMGTNTLVGDDLAELKSQLERILDGAGKKGSVPPLWDGQASERIANALVSNG